MWQCYPDMDVDLYGMAYDVLPVSSTFIKFLVTSATYYWAPPSEPGRSTEFEGLPPGFLLDALISHVRGLDGPDEGETNDTKLVPRKARHGLKNSSLSRTLGVH
jgi:hypothetical protein